MAELGHLGRIIQDWRDSMPVDVSVSQIAKGVGATRSWVGKWMRGEAAPNHQHLTALAELIGVKEQVLVEAIMRDEYPDVDFDPPNSQTG